MTIPQSKTFAARPVRSNRRDEPCVATNGAMYAPSRRAFAHRATHLPAWSAGGCGRSKAQTAKALAMPSTKKLWTKSLHAARLVRSIRSAASSSPPSGPLGDAAPRASSTTALMSAARHCAKRAVFGAPASAACCKERISGGIGTGTSSGRSPGPSSSAVYRTRSKIREPKRSPCPSSYLRASPPACAISQTRLARNAAASSQTCCPAPSDSSGRIQMQGDLARARLCSQSCGMVGASSCMSSTRRVP
mmetsp:Transcript_50926/g.110472  ORF Transcript_50926/g.110472 Transcript_50926/m.110472 type:complete len:248 (-) Transcript_50926:134-877(-)